MRKVLFFTAIIFVVSMKIVSAQVSDTIATNDKITEKAKFISERMREELSLSQSQYDEVYEVMILRSKDWKEKVKENKVDKLDQINKINGQAWKELKYILSDEQLSKAKELRTSLKKYKTLKGVNEEDFNEEDLELNF